MNTDRFNIVNAKLNPKSQRRTKLMQCHIGDEISYRKFKTIKHQWSTKYGPYNTIKEQGGVAYFYNVGKIKQDVYGDLEIIQNVDYKRIALGYNF